MGTTRIKATIDRNIISCDYYRFFVAGEDVEPVDLTVKLIHQYVTPHNTVEEIELENFIIPADFLDSSGLIGASDYSQFVSFNVFNPRYVDSLFVHVNELRDTSVVSTEVPVLDGNDDLFPAPTDNPFKDPEHEENQAPTVPEKNISTPEEDINYVIYSSSRDGLDLIQASSRIFLGSDSDNTFISQDYNEKVDPIYIENSITNFLPNASFFTASAGSEDIPANWIVESPGLILTSSLFQGDIESTNIFQLRGNDVNTFNALSSLIVKLEDPVAIYSGLVALTFSTYYTINSVNGNTPFSDFTFRFEFFDSLDNTITTVAKTAAIGPEGDNWQLVHQSLESSEIPFNAVKVNVSLEIEDINNTDRFILNLYLPQLESSSAPTTRTLSSRVQDSYQSEQSVELNLPLTFLAEARHILGPGLRGLASTTTNIKDGLHFSASSDRMRLKQFDVNGAIVFNIASDTFTVAEGEETNYSVYLDGTSIEFYLNGVLLSSHSQAVTYNQNTQVRIGSLEGANTSINTELLDFKILRTKP